MDFAPVVPKKKLNDEERKDLMKKLDDELDQFMDDMAARKKEENVEKKPFDFDEWCKEIDQHPCFMTDKSDIHKALDGKYGDTLAALQALKYSEDDIEDLQATAEKNKNEGNKHFGFKKYRWAIDCYTTGIKAKCLDKKLNGILYCNRAAAHKYIGNLRSAIRDCSFGRKFDPTNLKGVVRGAECLIELGYGNQAIKWIDSSKKLFAVQKELEENGQVTDAEKKLLDQLEVLYEKAGEVSAVEERNARRARAQEKKDNEEKAKLLKALEERKLNLRPRVPFARPELLEWSMLTASLPQLHEHKIVSFDEKDNLQWPVLVQYPEVGEVDVLTEVDENTELGDLLSAVLGSTAEWDVEKKFRFDNVRYFIGSEFDEYLMEIHEWMPFKTIFSTPGYQIRQGLPVIMVYTKEKADESFELEDNNQWRLK
ncbi:unnamed protein product [Auanema sp. JU1783]|nr:unnamed protein product [Auanema sp. JU1783]